jgi:hypothetical protein
MNSLLVTKLVWTIGFAGFAALWVWLILTRRLVIEGILGRILDYLAFAAAFLAQAFWTFPLLLSPAYGEGKTTWQLYVFASSSGLVMVGAWYFSKRRQVGETPEVSVQRHSTGRALGCGSVAALGTMMALIFLPFAVPSLAKLGDAYQIIIFGVPVLLFVAIVARSRRDNGPQP